MASTPRYTSNTSSVGSGRYWAKSPAISGPSPAPVILAAVATSDDRREADSWTISVSAAVEAPVIRPADSPDRTRPTNSQPTLEARMNAAVLTALKPSAAAMTGFRPTWSDACPASKRGARTPTA